MFHRTPLGALRLTIGNTEDITTRFSAHYSMKVPATSNPSAKLTCVQAARVVRGPGSKTPSEGERDLGVGVEG